MRGTILKISIVLLVIIFLPIGFFLVNEFTKLSQDEQMVEDVFNEQLESILYSVNQNSENIISYWVSNLDLPIACGDDAMKSVANNILVNNPTIESIHFLEVNSKTNLATYGDFPANNYTKVLEDEKKLEALVDFLSKDYQKIETQSFGEITGIYFLMKNQAENVLCFINVRSEEFIQQALGPQIQQVSQDLFFISVRDTISGNIVFEAMGNSEDNLELLEVPMWYFPSYKIGIRLLSSTIEELVAKRGQKGRSILWFLVLTVIIGAAFVIWNIRKEIRLAELKSGFVSNVSHEIRTPLALISMYAESLKFKRVKPEKEDKYMDTIYSESLKLSEIVNRVLNFSKIENNKKVYDIKPHLASRLIESTIESYMPHIEENKVKITYDLPKDIYIDADKVAVSEALINLFDNAIKYGKPEGKKINVRCYAEKENVFIEVEDNGIGISGKDKKYIFDKFFRVSKGDRANKVKGSGLGLNIVKQIMKNHHGSVEVKSKLGEGSTFRLKFVRTKNNKND